MSISRKLKNAASSSSDGGGGSAGGASDDVFSTYLYTGNGFSGNPAPNLQYVANGIDLKNEGGMVWIKNRSTNSDHQLMSTETGEDALSSNTTSAGSGFVGMEWQSDGFSVETRNANWNALDEEYVSWTFRKAPKFFDVVTYTGDGVAGREIPHNLGVEPGMIIIKCTSESKPWGVYHRSQGGTKHGILNETGPFVEYAGMWNDTDPTSAVITLGADAVVNGPKDQEYVAYLFAHDDTDESMIKCGSYTGTDAPGNFVDLGWEPQWVLIKQANESGQDWMMYDTMRGMSNSSTNTLRANQSTQEGVEGNPTVLVNPNGFTLNSSQNNTNAFFDYIYMAIRRPNKPAEEFEPEELFAVTPSTNTNPRYVSGFPVDMAIRKFVTDSSGNYIHSRLTGNTKLWTDTSGPEAASNDAWMDYNNGMTDPDYVVPDVNRLAWMWRRAPGFFDVVCYEGDGLGWNEVPHNLVVKPDMMWVKKRSGSGYFLVWHDIMYPGQALRLTDESPMGTEMNAFIVRPEADSFTLGSLGTVNAAGNTFIAYLFASVPGICDIGTYTGTGADLDIDCGFTTGARFVLIKRTNQNGDWMYFDTLRGITASDSPMLKLNENDVQATGSYIKPISSGFTVTSNLTGIDGGEYIYMAIA